MHVLLGVLFTLAQALSYPFPTTLVSSTDGTSIAYVLNERGVRSIWFAREPLFMPRRLWTAEHDDGKEITNLSIAAGGGYVVYVLGGDHDANWPKRPWPNPDSSAAQPHMSVLALSTAGGTPRVLGEGDAPVIAPDGKRVAFVHDGDNRVWIAPISGSTAATPFFFDRGNDSELTWSPRGRSLAFTSDRGDHSFVGVYRGAHAPVEYLAPSTSRDFSPRWSPHGHRIAFIRIAGDGGPPQDPLRQYPLPWSILVSNVAQASARTVWHSGTTLRDSLPEINGPQLRWVAGNGLAFISEQTNWPHLYVVSATGASPLRALNSGAYMVEDTAVSPDLRTLYYTANTGTTAGDDDRRHIFRVAVAGGTPTELTKGTHSQWWPAATSDGIAYVQAGPRAPTTIAHNGTTLDADQIPREFPAAALVVPQEVSFRSKDGWLIHGQIFLPKHSRGKHPAIVFVHGGPPRQMLLTWHYFDYYSYAYATNQYLASRGFIVLSVNYRLGIGYGHDFHYPAHAGPAGASEYQDVLAGGEFLQHDRRVDGRRIGIWGGSYGGYLTAMALAKNSNIFKAGSDFHGVHDWSMFTQWFGAQPKRYQQPNISRFMRTAWLSSPDAYVSTWRSPVLLIQGDDDRNVPFHQMVDLVQRLSQAHVPFEQIVLPNEIHGFLQWNSWLRADQATADFLSERLRP